MQDRVHVQRAHAAGRNQILQMADGIARQHRRPQMLARLLLIEKVHAAAIALDRIPGTAQHHGIMLCAAYLGIQFGCST
jgi:hypothetical protein